MDTNKSGTHAAACSVPSYRMDLDRSSHTMMQSHSITLGMNIPNAGKVTNQMWIQFLNDQVLPLLQYATITDSMGIYQGTLERSKTISVTTDDPAIVDALLEVGNLYKKAFNQDAIMYNATPVPLLTFR